MPVGSTEVSAVRDKALELLSYRDHSEKELLDKLLSRNFPKSLSMDVLDELRAGGLLDDYRFASTLVRERIRSRPSGTRSLASLLRSKGISREEADEVVRTVMVEEGVDEKQLAGRILRTEIRGKTIDGKARQRIWNKLVRKGFDTSVVKDLMNILDEKNVTAAAEIELEKL